MSRAFDVKKEKRKKEISCLDELERKQVGVRRKMKKSLAQEARLRERRYFGFRRVLRPLQPLLRLQHGRRITVRPVKGHLTPKMNITFSISKIRCRIFFYSTIFS